MDILAHDNVVSNVVLTKEMAGNSGMDWEWGFDYFTQKMYPETSSSKYHFHELDEDPWFPLSEDAFADPFRCFGGPIVSIIRSKSNFRGKSPVCPGLIAGTNITVRMISR